MVTIGRRSPQATVFGLVAATIALLTATARPQDPVAPATDPSGARVWRDRAGTFRIDGTLAGQDGESVSIRTRSGPVVKIPRDRLSTEDLAFLESAPAVADADTPATPIPARPLAPPSGSLRLLAQSASVGADALLAEEGPATDVAKMAAGGEWGPDPQPSLAALPMMVLSLGAATYSDVISKPVPCDADTGRYFVSITTKTGGEGSRSRIHLVDARSRAAKVVHEAEHGVRLLDHDPASGRSLLVDGCLPDGRGGALVLVEGLADGAPVPILRRRVPAVERESYAPRLEGRLLSAGHVALVEADTVAVWDLFSGKMLYRLTDTSLAGSSAPKIGWSGSARWMALVFGDSVRIFDTATGALLRSAECGRSIGESTPAFDPGGTRVALASLFESYLVDAAVPGPLQAFSTADYIGNDLLGWASPQRLVSMNGNVLDTALQASVWEYSLTRADKSSILHGSNLVAAAVESDTVVLATTPVLHPAAERRIRPLVSATDGDFVVRRGSAVKIQVDAVPGVDTERLRAALVAAAEANGWTVADDAPLVFAGRVSREPAVTVEFRSFTGKEQSTSSVECRPFSARIEIRGGGEVLWGMEVNGRPPPFLLLQNGQTAQQAVARMEVPNYGYFESCRPPVRIPAPRLLKTRGRTSFDAKGWREGP